MSPLAALIGALRRGVAQLGRRTPTQVLTVLTLAVAFSLAGLAWSIQDHLDQLIIQARGQFRLVVFLKPAPPEQLSAVTKKIAAQEGIVGARFISSREALDRIGRILGADKSLVEGLGPEAMPPLVEIRPEAGELNPDRLAQMQKRLAGLAGVEEVAFSRGKLERMTDWTAWLRRLGLGLALALALAGLFISYSAIRLVYWSRIEEIEVLRLIGASPWFIRGPYVVQGAVHGLAAAAVAMVLLAVYQAGLELGLGRGGPLRIDLLAWGTIWRLLVAGLVVGGGGAWLGLGRLPGGTR